jgi:hypothetical protein
VPKGSTINALAWFKSTKQLEVFWQDSHQNFVGQKYSVAAGCWQDMGTVVESLSPGARTTSLHWNSGEDLRVYYQAENNDIFERFLRKDSVSISVVETIAKSS